MKTKEAIQFVESFTDTITSIDIEEGNKNMIEEYNNKICKVIELLKCGEKYEAMVDELINVGKNTWAMWVELKANYQKVDEFTQTKYVAGFMNKLEQKYFPKPSKDFTEKVMEKINKKVEDEKKT